MVLRAVPFRFTVELWVNPLPVTVTVVAVFRGAAVGLIDDNVGAGGFTMETANGCESDGPNSGVVTVTEAVAGVAISAAGTTAVK